MIRNMFWNRVWAGCGICIIGDQCWTGALTSPRLLALRGKSLKGKAREEIPRPGQLTQQQGLSSLSPHFCCQSFCFSSITHSRGPASQVTTLLNWCCCMERRCTDSAPPSQNVGWLNDSQKKKSKFNCSTKPQTHYCTSGSKVNPTSTYIRLMPCVD